MISDVYFNLRRRIFSVRQNGKVVCHRRSLMMENVDLVVSQAGRARVLKEKRKNVHAYVRGRMRRSPSVGLAFHETAALYYNPYHNRTFVTDKQKPARHAKRVFLYIGVDGRPRMRAEEVS